MDSISYKIEPKKIVDEFSDTIIYIGTSINGASETSSHWRIKRINNRNGVWYLEEYPNGNQSFTFIWNDRYTYNYV